MKIAVFPGSFDPITKGHVAILQAALPLFDKIYVAVGVNAAKKSLFSTEKRKEWIKRCFLNEEKIEVIEYNELTVDLCKKINASYIIRGIRNALDFQYESEIAYANKQLLPTVETLFFTTALEYAHISSTIVRDVYKYGGDCSLFIPDCYNIYE